MDDFTWHARGQLCEQYATSRTGQRHVYRVGVFERKEYAERAAECVTACIGISSTELRAHGVVSLSKMVKVAREHQEAIKALEGVLPFLTGDYWPGTQADQAIEYAIAVARKAGRAVAAAPSNIQEDIHA